MKMGLNAIGFADLFWIACELDRNNCLDKIYTYPSTVYHHLLNFLKSSLLDAFQKIVNDHNNMTNKYSS